MNEQESFTERNDANADFDSLINTVTSTVHPDSWDTIGGPGTVSINAETCSLVVLQYPYVHEAIEQLLDSLQRSFPDK